MITVEINCYILLFILLIIKAKVAFLSVIYVFCVILICTSFLWFFLYIPESNRKIFIKYFSLVKLFLNILYSKNKSYKFNFFFIEKKKI